MTVFTHVPAFAGDPILSLVEDYVKDTRPHKVNLSIGVYTDDSGKLPMMSAVKAAETARLSTAGARPYLPMEGAANYREAVQKLVFGEDSGLVSSGRIATIQTLGGSGGLKVGGDFLKRFFPHSEVWVSDPTWDNHRAMFEGAGFKVNTYPYYDAATGGLMFDAMLAALNTLPSKSIVLLHACCHNPTGVDLSQAQWREVAAVVRERGLMPYVDIAYQGFGDGVQEDAFAVRLLATMGITFFVANSFSKSFSLYGERCGGLSVVCASNEEATRVLGQMKFAVRKNYSSPPTHGSQLVAAVLNTPELRVQWEQELGVMRERIKAMRVALQGKVAAKLPGRDLSFLTAQRGMFSYTGMSEAQVDALREQHAVYLVRTGRMCIAGLTTSNIDYVAACFAKVLAQ
jgi:aromatic-amino-acid transaminase